METTQQYGDDKEKGTLELSICPLMKDKIIFAFHSDDENVINFSVLIIKKSLQVER